MHGVTTGGPDGGLDPRQRPRDEDASGTVPGVDEYAARGAVRSEATGETLDVRCEDRGELQRPGRGEPVNDGAVFALVKHGHVTAERVDRDRQGAGAGGQRQLVDPGAVGGEAVDPAAADVGHVDLAAGVDRDRVRGLEGAAVGPVDHVDDRAIARIEAEDLGGAAIGD